MKKFDVVVMNPPYQLPRETSKKGGGTVFGGKTLWFEFVKLALKFLNDDGYLCTIHPQAWRKIDSQQWDTITSYQILQVNVEGKKHGGEARKWDIAIATDWYVLQKRPASGQTLVNGVEVKLLMLGFIPDMVSADSLSVFGKLVKESNGFNCRRTQINNTTITCQDVKDSVYKYPIANLPTRPVVYSRKDNFNRLLSKVIMYGSHYLHPFYDDGTLGTAQDTYWIEVTSKKEADYIIALLNSNLYKFVVAVCKWGGFRTYHQLVSWLPYPKGLRADFTDADLYEHFGLTQEEIELIERTVK